MFWIFLTFPSKSRFSQVELWTLNKCRPLLHYSQYKNSNQWDSVYDIPLSSLRVGDGDRHRWPSIKKKFTSNYYNSK